MGYFDNIVVPGGAPKKSGGYFDQIVLPKDQARADNSARMLQDAQLAQNESAYANSFAGVGKTIGMETGKRLLNIPVDFAKSLYSSWKDTPSKFVDDIASGSRDIQAGQVVKGLTKAAGRTAGDTVMAVYAPIGAAIGSVLNATGGTELVDKTGQVIADKSGITDYPAFQKFAMEHPNAGADFERILNLGFAGAEKGTINPKRMATESAVFAEKLLGSPTSKAEGARVVSSVRNLPVSGESVQTPVDVSTPKTRYDAYRKEQGYEPYQSPESLPTIQMGAKPKDALPTIQIGEKSPTNYWDNITVEGRPIAEAPAPQATPVSTSVGEPAGTRAPATPRTSSSSETVVNSRAQKLLETAVDKKLVDGLGKLPTHDKMDMRLQRESAIKFIDENPVDALRIAKGDALPPRGVLPESIYTALEAKAVRDGDVATIRELSKSKVPTISGQSFKALDSVDPNSPVKIMRDIQSARESVVSKRSGDAPEKMKAQEVKSIDKEIASTVSKRPTWEAFIDEITCGY